VVRMMELLGILGYVEYIKKVSKSRNMGGFFFIHLLSLPPNKELFNFVRISLK